MELLNVLCPDGKCSPTDFMALRLKYDIDGQLKYGTLEFLAFPFRGIAKEIMFDTKKEVLEYIYKLNEAETLNADSICLNINKFSNGIAKKTFRGTGNCILAGKTFYNVLKEDMCFNDFIHLYSVFLSEDLDPNTAIMAYRGKVSNWDAGLFLESMEDGKYKLYDIPNNSVFNGNSLHSQAKDYYVSMKLVD